jgi:ABC-type spermidine/putrescine transport system permease subunit I
MAVQVWVLFPLWLNGVLFGAIIVFVWRTFTSYMAYGWF